MIAHLSSISKSRVLSISVSVGWWVTITERNIIHIEKSANRALYHWEAINPISSPSSNAAAAAVETQYLSILVKMTVLAFTCCFFRFCLNSLYIWNTLTSLLCFVTFDENATSAAAAAATAAAIGAASKVIFVESRRFVYFVLVLMEVVVFP